ncbi:MAG: hypothetical protein COY40_03685 [Alphaproteobacteria bacterium CG_4_10_14_0_8_um_filter_53_9]|nr:MAG: hypothetical protein COY40_03685 [Alphaproteobacteria bacterium CG_4_10_14_0_8_um_filter_53_9]
MADDFSLNVPPSRWAACACFALDATETLAGMRSFPALCALENMNLTELLLTWEAPVRRVNRTWTQAVMVPLFCEVKGLVTRDSLICELYAHNRLGRNWLGLWPFLHPECAERVEVQTFIFLPDEAYAALDHRGALEALLLDNSAYLIPPQGG